MDRLRDLQALSVADDDSEDGQVTIDIHPPKEETDFMASFFAKVKDIKDILDGIDRKIDEVARLHPDILLEVTPEKTQELDRQLHKLMSEIQRDSNRTRQMLKAMDKANKDEEKNNELPNGQLPTELRIRITQHATLSRRLVQAMSRYNDVQARNKQDYVDAVSRQCRVVEPGMSDDQIQTVIESGTEGLFLGKRLEEAQEAVRRIEDRHKEIQKLEQSLLELHEMFQDMAYLIETQGEMINRIEYSVERSADYVSSGAKQTGLALTYQKAARRKMMCCLFFFAILVTIIVVVAITSSD